MGETQILEKLTVLQIIKVTFHEPKNGQIDWFFGSMTAIYDMFTESEIGCKLATLQAKKFEFRTTKTCIISKIPLYRKKQVNKKQSNTN